VRIRLLSSRAHELHTSFDGAVPGDGRQEVTIFALTATTRFRPALPPPYGSWTVRPLGMPMAGATPSAQGLSENDQLLGTLPELLTGVVLPLCPTLAADGAVDPDFRALTERPVEAGVPARPEPAGGGGRQVRTRGYPRRARPAVTCCSQEVPKTMPTCRYGAPAWPPFAALGRPGLVQSETRS
jgi:hypothetical protein